MRVFSLILYSALATTIAVSRHYNHSLDFLFQRLSIAVQRFNAVLIQETFDLSDGQPDL